MSDFVFPSSRISRSINPPSSPPQRSSWRVDPREENDLTMKTKHHHRLSFDTNDATVGPSNTTAVQNRYNDNTERAANPSNSINNDINSPRGPPKKRSRISQERHPHALSLLSSCAAAATSNELRRMSTCPDSDVVVKEEHHRQHHPQPYNEHRPPVPPLLNFKPPLESLLSTVTAAAKCLARETPPSMSSSSTLEEGTRQSLSVCSREAVDETAVTLPVGKRSRRNELSDSTCGIGSMEGSRRRNTFLASSFAPLGTSATTTSNSRADRLSSSPSSSLPLSNATTSDTSREENPDMCTSSPVAAEKMRAHVSAQSVLSPLSSRNLVESVSPSNNDTDNNSNNSMLLQMIQNLLQNSSQTTTTSTSGLQASNTHVASVPKQVPNGNVKHPCKTPANFPITAFHPQYAASTAYNSRTNPKDSKSGQQDPLLLSLILKDSLAKISQQQQLGRHAASQDDVKLSPLIQSMLQNIAKTSHSTPQQNLQQQQMQTIPNLLRPKDNGQTIAPTPAAAEVIAAAKSPEVLLLAQILGQQQQDERSKQIQQLSMLQQILQTQQQEGRRHHVQQLNQVQAEIERKILDMQQVAAVLASPDKSLTSRQPQLQNLSMQKLPPTIGTVMGMNLGLNSSSGEDDSSTMTKSLKALMDQAHQEKLQQLQQQQMSQQNQLSMQQQTLQQHQQLLHLQASLQLQQAQILQLPHTVPSHQRQVGTNFQVMSNDSEMSNMDSMATKSFQALLAQVQQQKQQEDEESKRRQLQNLQQALLQQQQQQGIQVQRLLQQQQQAQGIQNQLNNSMSQLPQQQQQHQPRSPVMHTNDMSGGNALEALLALIHSQRQK
jgi:hypothetical protein